MAWISDRWITLKEAAGHRRYLLGAIGVTALAALDWVTGFQLMSWLTGTPPLAVFLIVAFGAFGIWLLNYATDLRKDRDPKIEILEIGIHNDNGEQYVRVRIHNASSAAITRLKARLENISDEVGALVRGEELDRDGSYCHLDYPIQLFTQERLRERIAGGDKFVRPFNLAADEKRWIEIFQVTNAVVRTVHIYDIERRRDLITPDQMRFECSIHGGGAPVRFFLNYAMESDASNDAYKVCLTRHDGTLIEEKKFSL